MDIGTLTTGAGVETPIDLTYLPQFIAFEAATQLTSLKVEVLGEGTIVDLDADGLSTIGTSGMISQKTNGYLIPLADGLVKGKNVTLTFKNSAAQTPTIRAFSFNDEGANYIRSTQQKVFASSGIQIDGGAFTFISFENGSATDDELNVTFLSGRGAVVQKMTLTDLQIRNSTRYLIQNTDEDYYMIQDGTIGKIDYIPNADTTLYLQTLARV